MPLQLPPLKVIIIVTENRNGSDLFMKNIKRFFIPAAIVLVIAGYFIFYFFSTRTHWNDTFVNGNTAGNLYNNGIFCEYNGTVYFSNPADHHYLYSMNTDGSGVKKLYEDIASFINADDHYVYYVRNNINKDTKFAFLLFNTNSLCRYDLKSKKVKVLDTAPSIYASLIGNYLYYIHYDTETASTLYRIKIDGSDMEQVDKNPYFTCSANGQYLYYNGIAKDHNIYQMDTDSGISQTICQGNYWMPSADNENIYFLDCLNNYSLVKLSRSQSEPVPVVNDRIECYNVYGNTIYFQKNNLNGDAAFCSVSTDGSNYRVILEGNYTNINVTSQYVYFSEAGDEDTVYQMPLGGGSISVFQPVE